jgi:hypothetical protein
MKKILTLLVSVFCTLSVFGQSKMDYTRVNTVTQVGDTLIVKYQYFKGTDASGNDMPDAKLYQFDIQYNNKLLNPVLYAWQPVAGSEQKAINSWTGYKFTIDDTKEQTDFDGQYLSWLSGDASYGVNADWSVNRVTWQNTTSLTSGDEILKVSYKIKDKANSNYTDYTNIINVNWANYKEADGTQIDVTGQSNIGLTGIQGGDAGNVSISVSSNVITNNIGDGSDFSYTIITKEDMDDGDPNNDVIVASGTFDAAGDATVTGLENDIEYAVFISIDDSKEYLDNAVTVSDLALIFQEAIGAGDSPNGSTTTFDYYIQKLLGDVYFPQGDDPFTINFQDSYEVLAYLQGVTSTNTTYITKTGSAFNLSGIKSTFGDKGETTDYPTFSPIIKPTDSNKSFAFAHALAGDVNFSHGFEPTSTNAAISSQETTTTARMSMAIGEKYIGEQANLDLTSELKDGQVIFTIGSEVTDMVGAQFNINYDRTRLVLDDVIFDTGNTMTNFSNHIEENGKINIGSFDQNFEATVKTGTPYKLIFIPTVQLQNTSGLITFKVNEGVKEDGTQIKFIME